VSVSRKVVSGEWYGVLGDDVIVLLPPEAKPRVARVWETVDDGASFDEVLDALISGGLRGISGFVVVAGQGPDVKVVIRGAAEAELTTADGPVRMSGSADTTWVEHNVSGVTGFRVRVAEGTPATYTVGSGLLRVASIEQPADRGTADASGPVDAVAVPIEPSAPPEPAAGARILPPDPQLPEPPEPVDRPAPPEPAEPGPILPPDPQLEPPPELPDEPPDEPPAEPPAEPVVETPPAAPIPGAPVPVPVSGPLGGTDFDPLTSPDLAVSGQHAARVTQPVARLIFSTGEEVDVDRVIVIGRAPDHGRAGGDEQTRLVTVPSPHQEISSTHLEIRPGTGADHGSAVATDLGSTNGTLVVQPGLPAEDLRPGIAVQLVPGATVDLGEGVTIQVTGP
jgi:hypothetical protein